MRRCTRDIKIQKQQKKSHEFPKREGRDESALSTLRVPCSMGHDFILLGSCAQLFVSTWEARYTTLFERSISFFFASFLSWLRAWFWLCSKHAHTSFANLNGYRNMVLPARLRARWRCWSRRRAKSMAEQQVAAKSIKQIADFIFKKKEKLEFVRNFCWFDLLNYLEMLVGWRLDFAMVSSARWIRSSMPDWGVFI